MTFKYTKQKNVHGVEALCISTADINADLPCHLAAADIQAWGFEPHARIRAGLWWLATDLDRILEKLQDKIKAAQEGIPVGVWNQ